MVNELTNSKILSLFNNLIIMFIIVTTGVVIRSSEGPLTVGHDADITCHSNLVSDRIEWLIHSNQTVVAYLTNGTELTLSFKPVNDSMNGTVYTCRVIRDDNDITEQNITISVKGKSQTDIFLVTVDLAVEIL